MPYMIIFNVAGDDQWLRARIRGEQAEPSKAQAVIVETHEECERLLTALPRLKHARRKPYGGALSRRVA